MGQIWGMDEIVTLIVPRVSLLPERNWTELTFAKTSGSVTRDTGKKLPKGDQCVPSNHPRNTCGTQAA